MIFSFGRHREIQIDCVRNVCLFVKCGWLSVNTCQTKGLFQVNRSDRLKPSLNETWHFPSSPFFSFIFDGIFFCMCFSQSRAEIYLDSSWINFQFHLMIMILKRFWMQNMSVPMRALIYQWILSSCVHYNFKFLLIIQYEHILRDWFPFRISFLCKSLHTRSK